MGSPNIPAAPPPPDYAASTREGINTDISTLPLRNQINAAQRFGRKVTYIDPVDGKEKTADFSGTGDADYAAQAAAIASASNSATQNEQLKLRRELGEANARQTTAEIKASDPAAFRVRADLTEKISAGLAGKPDFAKYVRDNGDLAAAYEKETGKKLTDGDAASAAAWGERHFKKFGQDEGRELPRDGVTEADIETDTSAGKLNDRVRALVDQAPDGGRRLTDIYNDAAGFDTGTGDNKANLDKAYARAEEEFALGGKLDPDTQRELLNATRAGQVSRGNFLGDAAAVAEATNVGSAMEERKAQRLKTLTDIQEKVFGQNSALRNESRAAKAQRLGLMGSAAGQDFGEKNTTYANRMAGLNMENALNLQQLGENKATRAENYGKRQQALANASAMALGNPVTNQFGALAGANNGAVAYNPVNYVNGGVGTNANAGKDAAGFASNNYSTSSNNWSKSADLASQGNPWMSLLGNVAGSALGGLGGGLGTSLGKKF